MSSQKAVNAGVHAITGFELQKHFALYILLEEWNDLKEKKFFICLEHHDDFLFCHQTETELINKINSYQSKKSSKQWGMSKDFFEILQKIIDVGEELNKDPIKRDVKFNQNLYFITNDSIKIKLNNISKIVNESSDVVKFINLDAKLQDKLCEEVNKSHPAYSSLELKNLVLKYVDFPKKTDKQKQQLIGMFGELFGNSVNDHKAAVTTLINLFREIETKFNQGNKVKLLDQNKRIDSNEIKEAFKIITTQTKAYDLWRSKRDEIANIFELSMKEQEKFIQIFENSFDLFKDLKQQEHRKIFNYVISKESLLDTCKSDKDCIQSLYTGFIEDISTQLGELDVKAALFAAYIELKERI